MYFKSCSPASLCGLQATTQSFLIANYETYRSLAYNSQEMAWSTLQEYLTPAIWSIFACYYKTCANYILDAPISNSDDTLAQWKFRHRTRCKGIRENLKIYEKCTCLYFSKPFSTQIKASLERQNLKVQLQKVGLQNISSKLRAGYINCDLQCTFKQTFTWVKDDFNEYWAQKWL